MSGLLGIDTRRRRPASILDNPDPVQDLMERLPARPNPYGAEVTMPSSGFVPLDTVDPTARMALRAGVGQTVPQTARMYQQAMDAAGWGGTMAARNLPPMVALHNTRGDRLERIGRSGGDVVAPSIAISRADNPIESFGDISLLAGPQTVNPSRTPVYARDAYTPRYPRVETRTVRGQEREVIPVMNENTGDWRNLPHTPENALRVMRREPWRGGEDFITDNWLLGQLAPQFRNMSELRNARDRLVPATDTAVENWTKGLDSLRSEWTRTLSESGYPTDWRFADSLQRNLAEAAQRGRDGMAYINRTYYNNAIPEDLLARTQAHLAAGRELPATYFEAKPRRLVPLNEFQGAVVPEGAPQDVTDLLRRYGVEDIRYYANPEARREQIRNYERLFFSGAPLAAGLLGGAGESE